MPDDNQGAINLAVLAADVRNIKETVLEIKVLIKSDYVTKSEFEPVRKIVYGLVAAILTIVIVAVVTMVVRK